MLFRVSHNYNTFTYNNNNKNVDFITWLHSGMRWMWWSYRCRPGFNLLPSTAAGAPESVAWAWSGFHSGPDAQGWWKPGPARLTTLWLESSLVVELVSLLWRPHLASSGTLNFLLDRPIIRTRAASAPSACSSCLCMGITMELIKHAYTVLSNIYILILVLLSNNYCLSLVKSQQVPFIAMSLGFVCPRLFHFLSVFFL